MIGLLLIWLALLAALLLFAIGRRGEGGALTLAYFLGLSLIHVPGVLAFVDPMSVIPGREETRIGFGMTLIGMAALIVGAIIARRTRRRRSAVRAPPARGVDHLGWRALTMGAFAYFVLIPVAKFIPSATAVVAPIGTLLVVGLWLRLYGAAGDGKTARVLQTLAFLPVLPLATLTTGGFIGFGVAWALSVIAFLFVIVRRRIWFYLAAPIVVFLGLSLFVTYMGERIGIRDVVWQEHAGISDRLNRVSTLATQFRLLDLDRKTDLIALNDRLNQNWLVGRGVDRLRSGIVELVHGDTVSPIALIPRALWPDKPAVGGSGDLVAEFTGQRFAEGTSVGVGSVLEFYMNFGVPGLIVGFIGLGFLLMRLDQGLMRGLARGEMRTILINAMPGLVLLAPGGSFLEILVGFVAAIIVSRLIAASGLLRPTGPARKRQAAAAQSVEDVYVRDSH